MNLLLYYFILKTVICIHAFVPFERRIWIARAQLHADSSLFPIGTLIFTQQDVFGAPVRVMGTLFNLIPNTRYHGFHVHMFPLPDGELNCTKAGDHWNPYGKIHGDRFDSIERRHVGDLGNIWSDQFGRAIIDFEDPIIQLHPQAISSILDKSIVVHKDIDDLGRGMFSDSQTTGHSGPRIACGNIRLANLGLGQRDFSFRYSNQNNQRPFLSRSCDCIATTGHCIPYGNYQCSVDRSASIVQCAGRNQWIAIRSCSSSCRLSANGEPYCI